MEYTVPEPGYAALLLIAIPLGWHLRRRRRSA
jgi:hypothetical protein